jgi:nucleotide-binding universal stress UspA family protein
MNRRIVVGIDADIAPHTQHVLRVASSFLELCAPQLGVVLLHVIPVPDIPSSKFGTGRIAPTTEQREVAEQALHRARTQLQKRGIVSERIELLLRSGTPADEIVKAARELDADFIMVGSRGHALKQQIRRRLMGSTSQRVVQLARCPVMVAALPQLPRPRNLVLWYEEAITRYLHDHPGRLVIFTASEVAHLFAPPNRTAGRQEVAAASAALEQLARRGVLCCQKVDGELRCVND